MIQYPILFGPIWNDFAIYLSGNMIWNKLEVSWFESLEIPFKQQFNTHIISAEIFSEFNTFSSKFCCFDEERPLTFEVGSSTESGRSLAENLKKQDILLTTEIWVFPFWWIFNTWIPMFECLITLRQSLHLACVFPFPLTSQKANSC